MKEETKFLPFYSFCSGCGTQTKGERCPSCDAPMRGTTVYFTAWDELCKQYQVRLTFPPEFLTPKKEQWLKDLPIVIATKSFCSCGATLALLNHSLHWDGNQVTLEAVYGCNICNKTERVDGDRKEEISQQQELLKIHRATLHHYLRVKARVGADHASPAIYHGMNDAYDNIRRIKATLQKWGVLVEDHPDDEPKSDIAD